MTDPAAGDPMVSRYGRAPMPADTRRRITMILGVLVAAAGVGVAALAYQRFSNVDVEGKSAAFEVLDDQTVQVTVSVTRKNPSTPVVCIVRARTKDGAETGRRELLVPGTEAKTVQVTTTVKSFQRPAVGDVYGCGTDIPGYLVAP